MVNNSKEQIMASQNTIKLNNNLKFFKFSKNSNKINKLLNEYSMITAGMGVSSEIFLLDFFTDYIEEIQNNIFWVWW